MCQVTPYKLVVFWYFSDTNDTRASVQYWPKKCHILSYLNDPLPHRPFLFLLLSCGPDWTNPNNFSYSLFILISGFFVPLLIIISTSAILIWNLHKVKSSCHIQFAHAFLLNYVAFSLQDLPSLFRSTQLQNDSSEINALKVSGQKW